MTLKKEIEEILHPPRAPIVSEKPVERNRRVGKGNNDDYPSAEPTRAVEKQSSNASRPTIDFSYLTNNSSFQRAIIEFIKKFVPGFENVDPRGSKEIMIKSFDINAQNYRECMIELKEVLLKRKGS